MSNNNQNDFELPTPGNNRRKSSKLLPRFFRTTANVNFLQATVDQLIQPGVAEKLSGYMGRKTAKAYAPAQDNYIGDFSKEREQYQFEPSVVIKDDLNNVNFYGDYNDYINQLKTFDSDTRDHSRLNSQESYPWNPNIDWDKFVNFREYYWLPNGPSTINVRGQNLEIESTYSVGTVEDDDNIAYVFTPNGFTRNPTLKLYRGQTYRFEIDAPGHPIAFALSRSFTPGTAVLTAGNEGIRGEGLFGASLYDEQGVAYDIGDFIVLPTGGSVAFEDDENISQLYPDGIRKLGEEGEQVGTLYLEKGTIEFTIPMNAPDRLFYISKNDVNTSGQMRIYDIEENTAIDVENEILGKKDYVSENGITFSNGMKVYFQGNVTPEKYAQGEWYVEGVGDKISIVSERDLIIPAAYADEVLVPFDSQGFDRLPFGESTSYPTTKDYIVSNRSSKDRNAWARYNRWFHKDVIEESALINEIEPLLDQDARAKRPIIEFEAGLKLYNFGTFAKDDVDLIDNFTTDVFSTIEGSLGYNIDGVDVSQDMRILFTADTDVLVKNKIYKVNFIKIGNDRQISLIEQDDTDALDLETVLVTQGNTYAGSSWFYENGSWAIGQAKTVINQSPLYDLCCPNGNPYGDTNVFESTTFRGNKIFSYKEGEGANDSELGFPLSYRNIENSGDIEFEFNLLTDSFDIQQDEGVLNITTDDAYLRKYETRDTFNYVNGWSSTPVKTKQYVIREYVSTEDLTNFFEIDVYKRSGELNDLKVVVFLDNKFQKRLFDYEVTDINGSAFVRFYKDLSLNQKVVIKTLSKSKKTENGYYEFPINLERNPLNENINTFTLGEVIDHVDSMVPEIDTFKGEYPGNSNLRDLGDLDVYGRKFIKHSGSLNSPIYHLINQNFNIVKSIRYTKREYAKFKRQLIESATESSFSGSVKDHLDHLLAKLNEDKISKMPFYFSDMVPYGNSVKLEYQILDTDNPFYAISKTFTLNELSPKAILVYLNGQQLLHNKDYTFSDDGFTLVVGNKNVGDTLEINEYESTDGNYIPPTPTKLGLYPAYEPEIYLDDTYREPTRVIQGHDGSKVVAFNDYRDDIILEFERRIYNNIKQTYNTEIFDINDYVGGFFRDTDFDNSDINTSILTDFTQWQQLVEADYSDNSFYERSDKFTFNYSNMVSPSEQALPGYWRAVYKQAYDTDRPHTHPWEMLGFSVKPKWWNEVYGPAPYTVNNLILWEDLEEGIVREPNKSIKRLPKYARPGLTGHIPVDARGNLLSPLESRFAKGYIASLTRQRFAFGDMAPVESAWRSSSEYPFALLLSYMLNQPANVFAKTFDISRIARNKAGQLIYTESGKQLEIKDLVFPNTVDADSRTLTSGLINFVYNYISGYVTKVYDDYIEEVKLIKNQLGFKLGGFTEKSKFKLLLDSRTPYNEGNVFVPEENYKVFLNTSAPLDKISYSGIVIEKATAGFIVRGYNFERPYFNYYSIVERNQDPVVVVGGVSENFIEWQSNKRYTDGVIVNIADSYYRVTKTFTSGDVFETTNLAKLSNVPVVGGKRGIIRKSFRKNSIEKLNYGTILKTSQEVVDFILGYGEYLKNIGFEFENFNIEDRTISNWTQATKEFLFWTTQNWAEGTAITLSPSAESIKFGTDYATVDNLLNPFYDYGLILNADGRQISVEYNHAEREDNSFGFRLTGTEEGIYHISLPIVQKEHVVLIDNKTSFNDIIYQPSTGYKQDRIKVVGYRTDEWDGSLNAPGFIYDDAKVVQWEEWKDYDIGSIVKYKEFYYIAAIKVPGSQNFNSNSWQIINDAPENRLMTNFDYRINQFADYYDLDSDNFDTEQQKLAQHLIGYQSRKYLANIINDDVAQYKFYQGMIADKGTRNAIDKLFDALNSADKDSLDFYEDWAIEVGRYGATNKLAELEVILDEDQYRQEPQAIELTNSLPVDSNTDLIYRQLPHQIYEKPETYNSNPFPTSIIENEYIRTSGYVEDEEVKFRLTRKSDLNKLTSSRLLIDDYVWVVNDENRDWSVLQLTDTPYRIDGIYEISGAVPETQQPYVISLILNRWPQNYFKVGDYIGVENGEKRSMPAFYKIVEVTRNELVIEMPYNRPVPQELDSLHDAPDNVLNMPITLLKDVRVSDIAAGNEYLQQFKANDQKLWIDNFDGEWAVIENEKVFGFLGQISNPNLEDSTDHNFGRNVSISENNKTLATGVPGYGNGEVFVYRRNRDTFNWKLEEEILPPQELSTSESSNLDFGRAVEISPDGNYMFVSTPSISNIPTRFEGTFDPFKPYNKSDIVKYKESLWQATREIIPAIAAQSFTSYNSYYDILEEGNIDSTLVTLLVTGNAGLDSFDADGSGTDHFLVRVPQLTYLGAKTKADYGTGDKLVLNYNSNSVTHGNLDSNPPWAGTTDLTAGDLTGEFEIQQKVDQIFVVSPYISRPAVGDLINTVTGSATVVYTEVQQENLVIYANLQNGDFDLTGTLFKNNDELLVGSYSIENTANFIDELGGFFLLNAPVNYNNGNTWYDIGKGIIFQDLILESEPRTANKYSNSRDIINAVGSYTGVKNQASQAFNLTYQGNPFDISGTYPSNLLVIRADSQFDTAQPGENVNVRFISTEADPIDFAAAGFKSEDYINSEFNIKYVWDGFIDIRFSEFDFNGDPFELTPRYQIDTAGNIVDNGAGDIITDKQTPIDEFGGLSLNTFTTSVAEVLFYKREFNSVRVYIRNISGNWNTVGGTISKYEITRMGNYTNPEGIVIRPGEVNRDAGTLDLLDNNVSLGGNFGIGKLLVLETPEQLDLVSNPEIIDQEYWLFQKQIITGDSRTANYPISSNKDYTQVYNIPVNSFGTNTYDSGALSIYRRDANNVFQYVKSIVSQNRNNNKSFGNNIKVVKTGEKYWKIFVTSIGNAAIGNSGNLEIIEHGIKDSVKDTSYVGKWNSDSEYNKGDIVEHKNLFYRAKTFVTSAQDELVLITNPSYWDDINFRYNIDENYRGVFDREYSYFEGDIVSEIGPDSSNQRLYKAITNITPGKDFNSNQWNLVTDGVDYLGYLPNDTGVAFYDYDMFDKNRSYVTGELVLYENDVYSAARDITPSIVEENRGFTRTDWTLERDAKDEALFNPSTDILQFAKTFDVSKNGDVLVANCVLSSDSSPEVVVLIYRSIEDKFYLDQILRTKSNETNTGYGHSLSISKDGMTILVSEPWSDTKKLDQGEVYVYRQQNGVFEHVQSLYSPRNEQTEKFGYTVVIDDNTAVITSLNGDLENITSFDSDTGNETSFDGGFTTFNNTNIDSGAIYVFEDVNNTFLYAETLSRQDPVDNGIEYSDNDDFLLDPNLFFIGENVFVENNHIYIGMPNLEITNNYVGSIIDYTKAQGKNAWNVVRSAITPVDVDKIQGIFLYNKRTNNLLTYLDYIDTVQGKIAGPAEQELTYKTPYDPASYNLASDLSYYAPNKVWGERQVGELWWDIGQTRVVYPYQSEITRQTNNFNKIVPATYVNVYEWVESNILPSEWDQLSDTEEGLQRGISGISLYGDATYVSKSEYEDTTGTFIPKFYFWVRNKVIVPTMENRKISAKDVSELIKNPESTGYRYVSFLGNNKFAIHNCKSFINDKDIVINIQWQVGNNIEQNSHTQYQIMSEGLESDKLNKNIERKWFDSLIGYDENLQVVPDVTLSPKYKYGNRFTPRQSMFVNKEEALKQVIERVNLTLKQNIIIDLYDISPLSSKQDIPTEVSNLYDVTIDTLDELQFVGTSKVTPAKLSPVVVNGKLVRVDIIDAGRGYKRPPTYEILGQGTNAEIDITIDNIGKITDISIINPGENYNISTAISVRPFSVLVNNDSSVYNKWSIYRLDTNKEWFRYQVQEFDVGLFWNYENWYADGYNEFSKIDLTIDQSYELQTNDIKIGQIVKINNIGSGGWLLIKKIANENTDDYTINYETIGRQNGTIQFSSSLYDIKNNTIGYDNRTYDSFFYDTQPIREARLILETLRDNIFIEELEVEYNKLWFASLRYILSEQNYVDWVFKTSYIKVVHNLGQLDQPVTFQNNTLPSYEDYVEEVKPFSTTIREYLSSYEAIDNTSSLISDFDLSPAYDDNTKKIKPNTAIIIDNNIQNPSDNTFEYPRKSWYDNLGYSIKEVKISDGGTGFTFKPKLTVEGGGGIGAILEPVISRGEIVDIKVISPGFGYINKPDIIVNGSQSEGGTPAILTPILGDGLARTSHTKVSFDRVSGEVYIANLKETSPVLYGTGNKFKYNLEWPMDINNTKVKVFVDGRQSLRSEYQFKNIEDNSLSYTRYKGQVEFTNPPANGSEIIIEYYKPLNMLTAADRIKHGYVALPGMYQIENDPSGKLNFNQLMDGIDYGGVEVRSFEFQGTSGWDAGEWYSSTWDTFDNSFEDEIFTFDGSTISIILDAPLEDGVEYNVYRNRIRIDDSNYNTPQQTNTNAIMQSITGDGETQELFLDELGITVNDDDILVIRKITSDGSFLPDPESYDTALTGGDLTYASAQGIKAEEIIIDGDGFVTPTTSKGPEEIVPGQVLDTLDIKVYQRDGDGQGIITTQNYLTDGTTVFDLQNTPGTEHSIFVKLNNVILGDDDYTVDWQNNAVTLNETPEIGLELNIVTVDSGGQKLLDIETIAADGNSDYITRVAYRQNLSAFVTVNGEVTPVLIIDSTDSSTYGTNKATIRFNTPVENDAVIRYAIFYDNAEVNYTQISKDVIVADGSSVTYELSQEPLYKKPTAHNTIVKVGNNILNPGYNKQFVIETNNQNVNYDSEGDGLVGTTQYRLELFQQPPASVQVSEVEVYLNGKEITFPAQWRFDVFNNAVELVPGIGAEGDILEIYVITDGEYTINETDITFVNPVAADETIEVFRFTNHNILEIERINYDNVARSANLIVGSEEYVAYHRLNYGEIDLRYKAIDAQYVWVVVNGKLLSPNADYKLTDNMSRIKLSKQLSSGDVVDIIQFSADNQTSKFAFRQFKDMLNRTHYKRIDSPVTTLAKPLSVYDLTIELTDGSQMPEPNKGKNLPGIIFIGEERIEYLVKEGNLLRQLRRATLGTGASTTYDKGTSVFDQGVLKNIPYKDENIVQNFVVQNPIQEKIEADGTSVAYDIFDYDLFYHKDVTVTVDGIATEVTIRNNSIEFATPPAEGAIMEIISQGQFIFNLDFVPNSVNEFEVFAVGRRLRKTSIESFDPTVALDSPDGDIILPAEFRLPVIDETDTELPVIPSVGTQYTQNNYNYIWNGTEWKSSNLILETPPTGSSKVSIIRKIGKPWTALGESITLAENDIATFLRAGSINLLE